MKRLQDYVAGMLADPDGSGSSTRWCGVIAILTACGCAVAGVCRKDASQAATVTAIGAVGTACLFARTRSTPGA